MFYGLFPTLWEKSFTINFFFEEKADRIEEARDEKEEADENEDETNPRQQYFKFHSVMMFASM